MAMATEDPKGGSNLVTSRTPVGPQVAGSKGSPGDMALMDGVAVVAVAWVVLALLSFSLRSHNI